MSGFDLNINNYSLEDLLSLFKLDYDFTLEDLKKAKRIALKTHPDKSGLDKHVFLFFLKAYKMCETIYNFRVKRIKLEKDKTYTYENLEETLNEKEKEQLLYDKLNGKSAKEFNVWFNKMFEKTKIHDEENDEGYGSWFKSNENIETEKIHNKRDMNTFFERKKEKAKALVVHKDIHDTTSDNGYNLSREKIDNYDSTMFSRLQYQDLKQAHTVTVVPVTHKDFENKKKFADVESYKRHRETTNPSMISLDQSKKLMQNRKYMNEKQSTNRVFNMLKRDEEVSQSNKKWWSNLMQLEN
tara:strand:+ start:3939 stop:4832 length:894 start_codon:yes stop_codon:yes gene_type:complete